MNRQQAIWRVAISLVMFAFATAAAVFVGNRISEKFEENVLRSEFKTEFGVFSDDRSPQAQEVVRERIVFLCMAMLEAGHLADEREKYSSPSLVAREVLDAQERFMDAFSLTAQVNYPDNFNGCKWPPDEEVP